MRLACKHLPCLLRVSWILSKLEATFSGAGTTAGPDSSDLFHNRWTIFMMSVTSDGIQKNFYVKLGKIYIHMWVNVRVNYKKLLLPSRAVINTFFGGGPELNFKVVTVQHNFLGVARSWLGAAITRLHGAIVPPPWTGPAPTALKQSLNGQVINLIFSANGLLIDPISFEKVFACSCDILQIIQLNNWQGWTG